MFNLTITLPANRYRHGFFTLTDEACVLLLSGRALGKADNQRAAIEGNPDRLSWLPYGDTPTGGYKPTRAVMFEQNHRRIGAGWIPIEGASGHALKALQEGRTGLGIHAGRPVTDGKLMATYGCVRISPNDFVHILTIVKNELISVTVKEEV